MKCGEQWKKRVILLGCSVLIVGIVIGFLFITNLSQPESARETLDFLLVIMGLAAVAALTVFLFHGDIFDENGTMLKNSILFMMVSVICMVQLTLFFATFSFRLTDFNQESLNQSKELFRQMKEGEVPEALPEELAGIYVTGDDGSVNPVTAYRFPVGEDTVVMEISTGYRNRVIVKIFVDLLTVLAASIILTAELVIFVLKWIEGLFRRKEDGHEAPKEYRMVSYVRQIAFLFYFASRMGTPFIALLAKQLGGSFLGLSEHVLAGIPQSAEFFFTCLAIFLTSVIMNKSGWKLPFAGGLVTVAAGTVCSALAPSLPLFVLSRSLVGVGYGFCWMTLRNFALFNETDEEKALCFALLNAGIYAGMNCGAVIGSILADIIGYVPVLFLSSGLTILCAVPVIKLENVRYVRRKEEEENSRIKPGDILQFVWFLLLLIVPSCILGSYLGYYLPVYLTDLGGQVSDIGRAQLIYGLIIVYLGPVMVRVMQKHHEIRSWSVLYNVIFAAGLLLFGLTGGLVPAMMAVAVIGLADAFGFVAQNNCFLELELSKKLGHSRALSCISIIKKLAEMLGPVIFGLMFAFPGTTGVAWLGAVFGAAAVCYLVTVRLFGRSHAGMEECI